jgi:hypothetical protein
MLTEHATPAAELRTLTDEELCDLWSAGGVTLEDAEAEWDRREQAERTAQRSRERSARRYLTGTAGEWYEAAYAEYCAAERACKGNLLSALGEAEGITQPFSLWRGSEAWAHARASEELRNWWLDHPRLTVTAYEHQVHAAMASARDDEHTGTETPMTTTSPARGDLTAAKERAQKEARAIYERKLAELQERQREGSGQVAVREAVSGEVTVPPRQEQPEPHTLLRRALEALGVLLTDHVEFGSRSAAVAVALWLAQAAAKDSDGNPLGMAYPRLLVTSQRNGSGKSTVGDIARLVLQTRAGRMSKVTPYGLCKVYSVYKEAAILDDAQNVFRSDKAGAELLSIMINGYTPGATWVSGKSDGKIEAASGHMMVIGKDALITKRAEDLADLIVRSVIVRLDRPKFYMPELDKRAWARAQGIGTVLAQVLGSLAGELDGASADLAAELVGMEVTDPNGPRTMQIWRPLLAVARVADEGASAPRWSMAAQQAMDELSAASGDLLQASEALDGLEAVSAALGTPGRSFWGSETSGED